MLSIAGYALGVFGPNALRRFQRRLHVTAEALQQIAGSQSVIIVWTRVSESSRIQASAPSESPRSR